MNKPQPIAERIIGRALDDADVLEALREVDPSAVPEGDDDDLAWASESQGLEIDADPTTQRIKTVFMFAEGSQDYEQFSGELPGGIGFDWDRTRILGRFGKPAISGPNNDKWELDAYAIIVSYDDVDRVTDVTLTTG